MKTNRTSKIDEVIKGGYCIGCGLCAHIAPAAFTVKENSVGLIQATRKSAELEPDQVENTLNNVCPFTGEGPNESELAAELFGRSIVDDPKAGRFDKALAGYVKKDRYREHGSSGGMVTWFLTKLMKDSIVDRVIHVRERSEGEDGPLFSFRVSRTIDEVRCGAKSRYHAITYQGILDIVAVEAGTYAITGLPCFLKALRRLAKFDPLVDKRISIYVGLVCGHLKSTRYAEMMSWQMGIDPKNIASIDFRKKIPTDNAHRYGVRVVSTDGKIAQRFASDLYGTDWGKGYFKYHACDFCDDVLAETADVVFGDAWLPEYDGDWRGTNVIVIRKSALKNIFDDGLRRDELHLTDLSLDDLIKSQVGSFRHRRDGLAYRLHQKSRMGLWAPQKRVGETPMNSHNFADYRMHETRMEMAMQSHVAFNEALELNDFNEFPRRMIQIEKRYAWQLRMRDCFRGKPMPLMHTLYTRVKRKLANLFVK